MDFVKAISPVWREVNGRAYSGQCEGNKPVRRSDRSMSGGGNGAEKEGPNFLGEASMRGTS